MFDHEEYEKKCEVIRAANKELLDIFEKALIASGLSAKTIDRHLSNVDFYINVYLLRAEPHPMEDGVGMIRILRENISNTLGDLSRDHKGEFTIITGASGYKELLNCAKTIENHSTNIKIQVLKAINDFFGETITVAGLLTGRDIVNAIKKNNAFRKVIIPSNVLRAGERIFLDDMTIDDVERLTGCKIIVADYSGEDLINCLNKELREE